MFGLSKVCSTRNPVFFLGGGNSNERFTSKRSQSCVQSWGTQSTARRSVFQRLDSGNQAPTVEPEVRQPSKTTANFNSFLVGGSDTTAYNKPTSTISNTKRAAFPFPSSNHVSWENGYASSIIPIGPRLQQIFGSWRQLWVTNGNLWTPQCMLSTYFCGKLGNNRQDIHGSGNNVGKR